MFIGNDGGYFTILTISVKLKIDVRATGWDLSSNRLRCVSLRKDLKNGTGGSPLPMGQPRLDSFLWLLIL